MYHFSKAFLDTLLFSLPIIAGQIGHMLFGVGDTVILGHYSTTALSALGIATAVITPLKIVGLGTTYVISPFLAKRLAQNEETREIYFTSVVLGFVVGGLLMAVQFLTMIAVPLFRLNPAVATLVQHYLAITAVAMVPAILFQVLKENLQAQELTVIPNGIILLFNGVNIVLNLLFVFLFDWGLEGAAVATVIAEFLMAFSLLIYLKRKIPTERTFSRTLFFHFLKLGIPAGVGAVVTALVFSAVTIISGGMGIVISAANNLVITISSVTFMVPYAVSSAVSVKVGQKRGEQCRRGVMRYGGAAVLIGLLSAGTMALLFLIVPRAILGLMTGDVAVLSYGVALLFAVALYQIPDSIMCITMGALRGMGSTFLPMIWNGIGIWGIGFPVALWLAFGKDLKAVGLWYGLATGLSVTAVIFTVLFIRSVQEMRKAM